MPGIQDIINNAATIDIDRRKVVGIQITRNEIPRTSLTPTRQPWRFTIEFPTTLSWYNNRNLVEKLDLLDRFTPEIVSFNTSSCVPWLYRYQGLLTSGQIANITVSSFSGTTLTLGNLPSVPGDISATTVIFRPNDLIQIGANPYPFTVVGTYDTGTNTTTFGDVQRGSGSNVSITMHRPNFITSTAGANITVGPACQFNLFVPNMPTYKLIPSGYLEVNGQVINNARIEWTDQFNLYEFVGGAA